MRTWLCLPILISLSSYAQADIAMKNSETNYCQIIEKTINLPKLQQYFHVDVFPERIPLIVRVDKFISSCLKLNKFDKPIKIISSNSTNNLSRKVYLKFVKVNISLNHAEIEFTYKPEGIKGMIMLKKEKSQWTVSKSQIVEM